MSAKLKKPLTSAQLRKKYKFVVRVPKSSPDAYHPERPISGLVAHQLQHLQLVQQGLPARHRLGADPGAIKTEGQAATFVAHVTDALHRLTPAAPAKARRRSTKPRPRPKARPARRPARRGRRA
jgi:hypothetical protein